MCEWLSGQSYREVSFLFTYLGSLNISVRFKMLFFLWLEFPASIRMLSFFNLQASLRVFTIIQLKVFISHCSNSQHNTIEIALSKELETWIHVLALPLILQDDFRQITSLICWIMRLIHFKLLSTSKISFIYLLFFKSSKHLLRVMLSTDGKRSI